MPRMTALGPADSALGSRLPGLGSRPSVSPCRAPRARRERAPRFHVIRFPPAARSRACPPSGTATRPRASPSPGRSPSGRPRSPAPSPSKPLETTKPADRLLPCRRVRVMLFALSYVRGTRTPAAMAKLAIIRMTMAVRSGSRNMKCQLYGWPAAFVNRNASPKVSAVGFAPPGGSSGTDRTADHTRREPGNGGRPRSRWRYNAAKESPLCPSPPPLTATVCSA